MTDVVLSISGLRKSFGGIVAVDGIDLDLRDGEVHAVIGPNGAGKTTVIAQLGGALPSDAGEIVFRGRRITWLADHERARLGIARSFQITSIFPELSVLANVALAAQARQGPSYFRMWRTVRGDSALSEPALAALQRVGLEGDPYRPAGILSHGEHRQLEIAMALATEPSILLLDEPMAGMGAEESSRMVDLIRSLKNGHAILLVEHDMDAVFALADRVTVMVNGRVIRTGAPAEVRADAAVRRAYLGEGSIGDA
jgi:branched-chain amino acid transport system ATP-binding protein